MERVIFNLHLFPLVFDREMGKEIVVVLLYCILGH